MIENPTLRYKNYIYIYIYIHINILTQFNNSFLNNMNIIFILFYYTLNKENY